MELDQTDPLWEQLPMQAAETIQATRGRDWCSSSLRLNLSDSEVLTGNRKEGELN